MMNPSLHRSYAKIDLSALEHNFRAVREMLAPETKILSVIKADGYGHGAIPVAKTLRESDYFGVACLNEALELRKNGIETPILILGYTNPEEAEVLADQNITQCAFSSEYLLQLQEKIPTGKTLKVHLKIDTGMSRLGFYAHSEEAVHRQAEEISNTAKKTPHIFYEGIFTHFTSSECDPQGTELQFTRFTELVSLLERGGMCFLLKHCANSAATVLHPKYHLDMVRPGLILYGHAPGEGLKIPLKPVMELKAVIAQIHRIKAGDTVSYNRTYTAEKDMEIATVCIGYADGFPRHLSNGAPVLYRQQKARILGRICMDQCVIDVTGLGAKEGEEVTLFGAELPVEELAEYAKTISYEILCNIGKRIPRIYSK